MLVRFSKDVRKVLDDLVTEYNSSPAPIIEMSVLITDEILHHADDYNGYRDFVSSALLYMDSTRDKRQYK